MSFSAVLADRAARGPHPISFAGIINDDPHLSLTFDTGCPPETLSPLLQLRELSLKLGIWKGNRP